MGHISDAWKMCQLGLDSAQPRPTVKENVTMCTLHILRAQLLLDKEQYDEASEALKLVLFDFATCNLFS